MTRRVLFVCMGNICRSPAGEAVLKRFVERNDPGIPIEVDSAGTHGYHVGDRADPRMIAAAKARGYDVTSRARKVTADDLDGRFDLVLAADRDNLAILRRSAPGDTDHIRLVGDFLPADTPHPDEVPDPYYGGDEGFETVLDMLEAACPRIFGRLS